MFPQKYIYCFIACFTFLLVSCSKSELPHDERSSFSYSMDGSHLIPSIGVPSSSFSLQLPSPEAATSAPVLLTGSDSDTYIIAQGKNIISGNKHATHILATSTDPAVIVELLIDTLSIYAIHLNGSIDCYSHEGKSIWHSTAGSPIKQGAILAKGLLFASTDSTVRAYDIRTGNLKWNYSSSLTPQSLAFDIEHQLLYAAFTANDANATDSIIAFSLTGAINSRTGFVRTRITSNITIAKTGGVGFGYLSGNENIALQKTAHIALWSLSAQPKKIWEHPIAYIVSNVSTNGILILASGFRENGGELISGIDAFNITDSTTLWKRRFSYPIVSTMTISNAHAYIPFTFTTQASVPTKTVVAMISLGDGSTMSELPIDGAKNGFVQGIATAADGMLLYADRNSNNIYFLKP